MEKQGSKIVDAACFSGVRQATGDKVRYVSLPCMSSLWICCVRGLCGSLILFDVCSVGIARPCTSYSWCRSLVEECCYSCLTLMISQHGGTRTSDPH
jgi:hypothetical protein